MRCRAAHTCVRGDYRRPAERALLDTLSRRTFDFFWETTNPRNGLTPDRWPTKSFSSVAAVGFALTAYPDRRRARLGDARRGARPRAHDAALLLDARRRDRRPPASPATRDSIYHFLDMETGCRFETVELSTIDTALLLAGALTCRQYFDGADAGEREIRALADSLYARVDWQWARDSGRRSSTWAGGPSPAANQDARGFNISSWRGYNEGMLLYILALGSPTHPDRSGGVDRVDRRRTSGTGSRARSSCSSRRCSAISTRTSGSTSAACRTRTCARSGIDYFENSRRATLVAARVRDRQSARVARLRRRRVGTERERRSARFDVRGRRAPAHVPHVLGARRRHRRDERRRHDRADGGGRIDRLRAGDRHPGARRRCAARYGDAAVRPVRLRRRVQPDAARRAGRRCTTAASSTDSPGSTPTISASTRDRSSP